MRFFKFYRGQRCSTQNCDAGVINNDIQVVVVDIEPTRVNARGHSTPYLIERIDGVHFPQSRGSDSGNLHWYRFAAVYCTESKLRPWEATDDLAQQIRAAAARPAAMALGVLVGERTAAGLQTDQATATATALLERVEDTLAAALAGAEPDPKPGGWTFEEALEQRALGAMMDMLLSGGHAPPAAT